MHSYQLYIVLNEVAEITIGKLGTFVFPAGHYVYTGSAKRNIHARVQRHLSIAKKLRWHIDYLLADPHARIDSTTLSEEEECQLNQRTSGEIIVYGFGASDCRQGCVSHLKYCGGMRANT